VCDHGTVTRNRVLAVVVGAVVVVVALAVLTPTVIVSGGGQRGFRVVAEGRLAGPGFGGGWEAFPVPRGRPAPLPGLRQCLERHGFGRPSPTRPPNPDSMRRALHDCAPSVR
jgi:hypothetical protein